LFDLVKPVPEDWPDRGAKGLGSNKKLLPISLANLARSFPALRPPVVDGIARQGETVNIIAPSKIGKSWLAWGLALSITSGRDWLGRFPVTRGNVLYIDNELHPETIVWRGCQVAEAMGVDIDDPDFHVNVLSLRGQLLDYEKLASQIGRLARDAEYAAVIVDSHYRMLPAGTSENDNAGITRVYNLIDKMAEETKAMWPLIHHSSKGDQSDKGVTDVGSGAGAQSRAADCHIILRRHKESGAFVLEGAARSFAPVAPVGLRWALPIWTPDSSLDPHKLDNVEARKQSSRDDEGNKAILDALKKRGDEGYSANVLARNVLSMGSQRCGKLLRGLAEKGLVKATVEGVSGNETTVYRYALSMLRNPP
jgi:hypothetical protein